MSYDLAWAAGLFDGEGYVGISGRKNFTVRMSLAMTDAESVWRFFDIIGRVGKVADWSYPSTLKKDGTRCKPCRRWYASGANAMNTMELLSPWLSSAKLAEFEHAKKLAPHAGFGRGWTNRQLTSIGSVSAAS
jgi:hypothetical protein